MSTAAASAAITRAFELLGRATQDWRNGTADVLGALHWPVAVNLGRRRTERPERSAHGSTARTAEAASASVAEADVVITDEGIRMTIKTLLSKGLARRAIARQLSLS